MKMLLLCSLALLLPLVSGSNVVAQNETAIVIWQVTGFDVAANVQQVERSLSAVATLNATNVGRSPGRTFTVRLNPKASVKTASVGGAVSTFRISTDTRGDLQRVEISLPAAVPPGSSIAVTLTYVLPVESNNGLAAISPVASQFLPLSFWYPTPNTVYTVRGADVAPFHLSVNLPGVISSGVEKTTAGSASFEQNLSGQPFFVHGDWDRVEGSGEGKSVTVFLAKGAPSDERKQAEVLIAHVGVARAFCASLFGPAPDVPVRLVSVRRGAGFSDGGTVLVDEATFRRPKLDAATALSVAEAVTRIWLGGQTPIRGEGSGALRDGLVRFIATLILEKQFGRDAAEAELLRSRLAYMAVARRDGPLSQSNQLDSTYFGSVPNRGAMVWRLVDHRIGREAFVNALRTALQAGKSNQDGFTLAGFRTALIERGGESLKLLLDQQLDQIVDTDLLVGLPQQRGADWVSALRNLGATDVSVSVIATTDRGEQLSVEATVPGRNFGEAVFKTSARIVKVEVDPDKFYPQLDFANDAVPRTRDLPDGLAQASSLLGAQDYLKAEAVARELLATAPRLQEARILLARSLLGQNRVDDAEKLFRAILDQSLPTAAAMAWAYLGLGEISLKKGQATEAAKLFNDAVHAGGDYSSSLAARGARIRAEAAANSAPPIDESARTFIAQLGLAITSGKKSELESRVLSGELVKFVNGIVGTQPEIWEMRVLRTEQFEANLLVVDVGIRAKQLGQEGTGTAVLSLTRTPSGWKLSGVDLFEVR